MLHAPVLQLANTTDRPTAGNAPVRPFVLTNSTPAVLPGCSWSHIFQKCQPTHNTLLAGGINMTNATFAGWALGYIVAGNAYCGQFNRTSPNCSYPCENNNEVCAMAGALQYGVYSCPDSLAHIDCYCMVANNTDCLLNQDCAPIPLDQPGSGTCQAQFKAKFQEDGNFSAYLQYLSDWGTTRRSVWGCCVGSNTKWMNEVYCDRFASFQTECESQPECNFNTYDGTCKWKWDVWLDGNIADANMTEALYEADSLCASATTPAECSEEVTVEVDHDFLFELLNWDYWSVNPLVNDTECVVWETNDSY